MPVMCAWEWFPKRRSTVTGCILCGYGFGAFIFGIITTAIANPNDLKPDIDGLYFPIEVANKVPLMLRVCTACWGALFTIAICTIKRNPEF